MTVLPAQPPAGRHFLILNGIEAESNDLEAWNFRAADAINRAPGPDRASTYHYEVKWWNKWFLHRYHVPRLAAKLELLMLSGRPVVPVAHSYGADLLCAALARNPRLVVSTVHLIGAACDRSFETNGLNAALLRESVGRVVNQWNPGDPTLRLANFTVTYGDLGRHRPHDVDPRVRDRVFERERLGVGHSGYFKPGPAFDRTLQDIVELA